MLREQIKTLAELVALPVGTVVRSDVDTIASRYSDELGVLFGDERPFPWKILALPATVLFRPDAPATPDAQAGEVAGAGWTIADWEQWAHDVAATMPESWDGDEAEVDLIARFVEHAAATPAGSAVEYEVTVTPVDDLRPDSDVIERAARVLTEALFKRSPYLSADQNDASKSDLYAQLRDSWVPTLAAAGLLTPSGTFASTKPSDADVAERCPECRSTQLTWFSHYPTTVPPSAYNLTEPTYVLGCDECSATVRRLTMDEALPMLTGSPLPNTDVADETALAAQVRADLEAAGILAWTNGGARIVQTVIEYVRTRSHATPPVAATGEEVDHYPMSAISMRGTSAVCDWCGQVFESSDLYREHERVMVLARRAREAAATGEGDDRG